MSKAPEKIATLINQQIHNELYSHSLYLAMSAFFERGAFKGFAKRMKKQAKEEYEHAIRFYDYLIERGNDVTMKGIDAPKTTWKSPAEIFKAALAQEKEVTRSIYAIYEQALAAKDYGTVEALNWFVKEQVEEEDSATEILDRVELCGADTAALLLLDIEEGKKE